jgi:hypothetical protein
MLGTSASTSSKLGSMASSASSWSSSLKVAPMIIERTIWERVAPQLLHEEIECVALSDGEAHVQTL